MEATHFHTVFTFVASPKVVPTSSVVLVLLPSRLKPVTRLTTALDGVEADGTTHIRMLPLEFMQRLAALVPRPRLHLIRFHGVLAPNAGLRAAIVPGAPQNTSVPADEHAHDAPACMGSARLLKRVFDIGYRPRTLPAVRRRVEDHRRHRGAGGDCQDPHASGLAGARVATCTRAAAASLRDGLIGKTRAVVQQG